EPSLAEWVVPITAVISLVLFSVQRYGTNAVGRLFGPVMIAWFVSIGACGVKGILGHPQILKALSPTYAATFVFEHSRIAFFALAAVVLAVTGAEALYADMGHFGRRAITRAWLFLLTPHWAQLPMVLLATAATVIASQAVITGAYSVASAAAHLSYLPR